MDARYRAQKQRRSVGRSFGRPAVGGREGGRLLRLGSVRIIDGIVRRNCCWEPQRRSTWRRERIYRWWSSSWIRAKAGYSLHSATAAAAEDRRQQQQQQQARGIERMHASVGFEGHRFNLATSKAARRKMKRTR